MGQSNLPRHSCPCVARNFTSSWCKAYGSGLDAGVEAEAVAESPAQALAVSAVNKAMVVIFRIMVKQLR